MPPEVAELAPELSKRLWPPWGPIPPWDPIPDWFQFDEHQWQQFAKLEIRFKMRELEIQREKIEQISQFPTEVLRKIIWPRPWPPWDPIPDWAHLAEDHFKRFAQLELKFQIQELEVQREKFEQLHELFG